MDVKAEIKRLEEEALEIVADAKADADLVIESAGDEAEGIYDDAARLIAEAEAKAEELRDEARDLARKYIDIVEDTVEDVKEEVEEVVEDAKGFFARHKKKVIAAAIGVALVVVGLLLI
jgi:vacuolar-type H+-ATPase subunit H